MSKKGLLLAAACVALVAAGPVLASGFSIYEQSAKASGQAGAWIARADDAAANWYNPAALTRMDGMQIQFGINLITVGSDSQFTINDGEESHGAGEFPSLAGQLSLSEIGPAQSTVFLRE